MRSYQYQLNRWARESAMLVSTCNGRFHDNPWVQYTVKYKTHTRRQYNCWSLRCSWNIACRRCSNYIFILNLTPGFNRKGEDICKSRRETFKFKDLVPLVLEIWASWWLKPPESPLFFSVMQKASWCHSPRFIITHVHFTPRNHCTLWIDRVLLTVGALVTNMV